MLRAVIIFFCILRSGQALAAPFDLLIAGFGGYGSCSLGYNGHQVAREAAKLQAFLATSKAVHAQLLLSCFDNVHNTVSTHIGDASQFSALSFEDLRLKVESLARKTKQKRVILIGHSHGGWLAMHTASQLAPDIALSFLVTIDPISREACPPLLFGSGLAAKLVGDPYRHSCEQFPPDITDEVQFALARRSKGWLHLYQTRTSHLHSSGSVRAHVSREMVYPQIELNEAHSFIAEDPDAWHLIRAAVYQDQPMPPQTIPAGPAPAGPATLFNLPQGLFSARVFMRYRKSTAVFYPRSRKTDVALFQPNVEPILGANAKISANIGVGYGQSLPFVRTRTKRRGVTRQRVLDLHYVKDRWGVDLFLHDYKSLFRERFPQRDTTIFGDTLFRSGGDTAVFPNMRMRGIGLDALYTLWPERFSYLAAMSQRVIPTSSGWSPTVFATLRYNELSNPDPILPADIGSDPRYRFMSGYHDVSFTVLPGLAGIFVMDSWYVSMLATYGYGIQHFNFKGAPTHSPDQAVAKTNIQGALGTNRGNAFFGIMGYYSNMSRSGKSFGVYESLSSVELFLGKHF